MPETLILSYSRCNLQTTSTKIFKHIPAVYEYGSGFYPGHVFPHGIDEVNEVFRTFGASEIGPVGEVHLLHKALARTLFKIKITNRNRTRKAKTNIYI